MNLVAVLEQAFGTLTGDALRVVETGSIRTTNTALRDDDGWSTLWFAGCLRIAAFFSIDLDCAPAGKILEAHGLRQRATLMEGDSVQTLKRLGGGEKFDVAFLDSASDPLLIQNEFMIARDLVKPDGLILIDDVKIPEKSYTGGIKGDLVVPYLVEKGLPYQLVERNGPNYSTGVLIYKA